MWVSTQAPFAVRGAGCTALGLAPNAVRVVAPVVGGGFGAKGGFAVAGVPARAIPWEQVVAAAFEREVPLASDTDFAQPGGTFPSGTHVAVVEVDTETGAVRLRRLVAVDDWRAGPQPDGRRRPGARRPGPGRGPGPAQALFEAVSYDEHGNPLTVTLADYLCPSAADLPSWELGETVTPSPRNPLGAKGIGESGAVGSTPAVQNAVIDALVPHGVTHIDLPFCPQRVWEALRASPG